MTNSLETCPSGWVQATFNGLRLCGRPPNAGYRTCSQTIFSTGGMEYRQVCGQALGYQYGDPTAFGAYIAFTPGASIDDYYLDGLTLTHGQMAHDSIFGALLMDSLRTDVAQMLALVPHLLVASLSPLLLDPTTFVNLVLLMKVISIMSSSGMELAVLWLGIPAVHLIPLHTSLYNYHQLLLMISMDDFVAMKMEMLPLILTLPSLNFTSSNYKAVYMYP